MNETSFPLPAVLGIIKLWGLDKETVCWFPILLVNLFLWLNPKIHLLHFQFENLSAAGKKLVTSQELVPSV